MKHRGVYGFFLCLVLLGACSKDEEILLPVVDMIYPVSGSYYSVPDSIPVVAHISHHLPVRWIEVSLVTREQQPVGKARLLSNIDKKEYTLDTHYSLDDVLLPGGEYYLQVKVSDGKHTRNGQAKVYVDEASRVLQYYLLVARQNPNNVDVIRMDTVGNFFPIFTQALDYMGSAYLSRNRQLILAGEIIHDVMAFDKDQGYAPAWHIPASPNPPEPWFTAMASSRDHLLLALRSGELAIIDRQGKKKRSFHYNNSSWGAKLLQTGEHLLTIEENHINNNRHLTSFFVDGGGIKTREHITFQVEALYERTPDKVLITANDNGIGAIYLYDLNSRILYQTKTLDNSEIISSCQVGPYDYLLAGPQNIYWYQVPSNSLTVWKQGYQADRIYFEETQNTVIVVNDNEIEFFDFPVPVSHNRLAFSNTIYAVHPVYNK